jgi:hypothetical protein
MPRKKRKPTRIDTDAAQTAAAHNLFSDAGATAHGMAGGPAEALAHARAGKKPRIDEGNMEEGDDEDLAGQQSPGRCSPQPTDQPTEEAMAVFEITAATSPEGVDVLVRSHALIHPLTHPALGVCQHSPHHSPHAWSRTDGWWHCRVCVCCVCSVTL